MCKVLHAGSSCVFGSEVTTSSAQAARACVAQAGPILTRVGAEDGVRSGVGLVWEWARQCKRVARSCRRVRRGAESVCPAVSVKVQMPGAGHCGERTVRDALGREREDAVGGDRGRRQQSAGAGQSTVLHVPFWVA